MVRDLLRPEAYPFPTPKRVELETTHISWVFLTEDRAWKVKRPVSFGFLDFSSPAVKMRRLPAACSARVMVLREALMPAHLAALAERLARFYADAPESRDSDAWDVLRDNVEENLIALDARRSRATWPFTQERGRIRDGHGDLRLDHVHFPVPGAVDPVAGVWPTARGPEQLYSATQTTRTYEELFRRADLVLGSGRSVVLDATFARAELRHRARAVAAAHNSRFVFIEATCDEPTLRARLLPGHSNGPNPMPTSRSSTGCARHTNRSIRSHPASG